MTTRERLDAMPAPDMSSCPYRREDLRTAYIEGHKHFRLPNTHPLRGVQDATTPRGQRIAFSRGWKDTLAAR